MTLDFIFIHSLLAGVQSVGHVSFFTTSQIKFEKMGSGCTTHEPGYTDSYAIRMYNTALGTCFMPDVGIDESLMKFSGVNSNIELQIYSDDLLNSVPGYIEKVGAALGSLKSVPNGVGFGALMISMILELVIKGSSRSQSGSPYSMLRRVFGEEKASSVRDTMLESVRRYQTFMDDNQRLIVEIRRLEALLSIHLTTLRNSLLHDDQMSSRGFKIWTNGAFFHVQMRIHEARLNIQAGRDASSYLNSIKTTINLYLVDLIHLKEKYLIYKYRTTELRATDGCYITDTETNCGIHHKAEDSCTACDMSFTYTLRVHHTYEPVRNLRSHFSNIKDNINILIHQNDAFTLPTIA